MVEPGFILSTGRTGTKFFEKFFTDNFTEVVCLHEPRPSRRFKVYSNLYLNNKLSSHFISVQYIKTREKFFRDINCDTYIESNNFMFGCVPALNQNFKNIKILHIVRHPEKYVISHLNHGFWKGHKRIFAKYFPYWLESVELNKKEKKDPLALLAHRWNYVNSVIVSYRKSNLYLLERFEDIFSSDEKTSIQSIKRILNFFDLPEIKEDIIKKYVLVKSNASKPTKALHKLNENEKAYIKSVCKNKMKDFGY